MSDAELPRDRGHEQPPPDGTTSHAESAPADADAGQTRPADAPASAAPPADVSPAGEWPACPPEPVLTGPPVPNRDLFENGSLRVPRGEFETFANARYEAGAFLWDEDKPVQWLWPERVALSRVTLLEGASGTGKSWLALDMAARVTRGAPWPGGSYGPHQAGDVLLVCGDPDGWNEMIRPRLLQARANLDRVGRLTVVETWDPLKPRERSRGERRFSFPADLPLLEYHIRSRPKTRLVVLDPLSAFCANDRAYRETLRLLDEIAARQRVAIVVIARPKGRVPQNRPHLTPDRRAETVRAVFHVVTDLEDENQQYLASVRINFAAKPRWLPYQLSDTGIVWGEPPEAPPESASPPSAARARGALRRSVMEWMRTMLEYSDMTVSAVSREAKQCGFSEATLRRAREDLGVWMYREGFGPVSICWWTMKPKPAPGAAQGEAQPGPDGVIDAEAAGSKGAQEPNGSKRSKRGKRSGRNSGEASGRPLSEPVARNSVNDLLAAVRSAEGGDMGISGTDLKRFGQAVLTELLFSPPEGKTNGHPVVNGHGKGLSSE